MRSKGRWAAALLVVFALGCGGADGSSTGASSSGVSPSGAALDGEVVTPPFAVQGDAAGLVLTWFDEAGAHVAAARAEVPEGRRAEVRVDSLELPPDARDPEHVFVADLRAPGADGRYVVRRVPREAFDARVDAYGAARREALATAEAASAEVTVFGASWCGACRQAEAYLRQRGVPFVERDVEREPGAAEEMQRRAARAGISPRGIPVIDVGGQILQGFDPGALDRALAARPRQGGAGAPAIVAPAPPAGALAPPPGGAPAAPPSTGAGLHI